MYIVLHTKYPLFLSDFNWMWFFLTVFQKILKYQISWQSVQREPSCSTQTGGLTDMMMLIVVLCNFWKHLKMRCIIHSSSYPMSTFQEIYNELLAIKNCVAKLSVQPSCTHTHTHTHTYAYIKNQT